MPWSGLINTPTEVDLYNVHLYPGDYFASATGSSQTGASRGLTLPDPYVVVLDPQTATAVAVDDNSAGGRDAVTIFRVPAEKDYLVAVGDLTGNTGTYEFDVFPSVPGGSVTPVLIAEFWTNPRTGQLEPLTGTVGTGINHPGQFGVMGVQEAGYSPDYLLS